MGIGLAFITVITQTYGSAAGGTSSMLTSIADALGKLPMRSLPDASPFGESLLSTALCLGMVFVLWRFASSSKKRA
jgi:hypothetical protein